MDAQRRQATSIALLLPGQGSQFVGMGRDLARGSDPAADVYRRADEILGIPLSRISWEGPSEELTRTENAQPAILTHSYAVWRALPDAVRGRVRIAAGHSLGEFTAYLTSGALSFPDALRLVRRRGELMAESREGTMAAVLGLEAEEVEAACESVDGTVVAANYNAPGQVVVSGSVEAVEAAGEAAEDRGARRVLPLQVSGAFHSPLMEVAREGLRGALEDVPFDPPRFPVVANAAARPVTDVVEARSLLVKQLTSPVRWTGCIEAMREAGPDRWLEIGPGSVLTGLLRRIDRSLECRAVGTLEEVRAMEEETDG